MILALDRCMLDLPLHPKLVHVPLGLAVITPLLLVMLFIAVNRGWLPPRAWWLGTFVAVIMAGSAWLAVQAGEAEEERVEGVVAETFLEEHEQAGQQFAVAAGITALLALGAGFVGRRRVRVVAQVVAVFAAFATLGLGIRAGHLGGELVYRHGAASVYTTGSRGPALRADDD